MCYITFDNLNDDRVLKVTKESVYWTALDFNTYPTTISNSL